MAGRGRSGRGASAADGEASPTRVSVSEVVLGSIQKPPEYGKTLSAAASRRFLLRYAEYERVAACGNEGRVVQRKPTSISELLLVHIRKCLSSLYFEGKKILTEAELREGLSLNAETSGEALVEPAEAKAGVTRAASMKPSASVLERVYAVHSALECYLAENPNVAWLHRNADDEWLEESEHVVSKALVKGISPPEFKANVESSLGLQGNCKTEPERVIAVMVKEATDWKKTEKWARWPVRLFWELLGIVWEVRGKTCTGGGRVWKIAGATSSAAAGGSATSGSAAGFNRPEYGRFSEEQKQGRGDAVAEALPPPPVPVQGTKASPDATTAPAWRSQSMDGVASLHAEGVDVDRTVPTTNKACPLRLALHTEWGPVVLEPFRFSVMPGEDDTILLGGATLKKLGIDVYGSLAAHARQKAIAAVKGVENAAFHECRRVAVAAEALQHNNEEEPVELRDEAVTRAFSRKPNMSMVPEEEKVQRKAVWASPAMAVPKPGRAVMTDILQGLSCMVWVDDVAWWGIDETDLLNTLDEILRRLEDKGIFAAAHKCLFFDTKIKCCGKAVNWLRTSLPRLAEVVEPLRRLLEEHMASAPRRTKRIASNRPIESEAWTAGMAEAWTLAQDLAAHAVALSEGGFAVLMFPDASDEHWGTFLTQVQQGELERGVSVEDMTHKPLAFLTVRLWALK
ncbi:unnamed protein product [Ectocarpus sp. CCAP 1310/34]|nr:unnamed protein product [Ectocarpus sp. CCAP 1310/34]